ncbi:MAG: SufS family cysteine desulfurase [Planctomyces sp.]|nr:SufS family cysteine desulfurase [Planctomyces sp.]
MSSGSSAAPRLRDDAPPAWNESAVRREFPIFSDPDNADLTYLDTAATAQKPGCVIDREAEVYRRSYANAYRGVYRLGALVDDAIEETRQSVRGLIGAASSEEIVFTSGTTAAINIAALGWSRRFLQPGDEILLSPLEHHANIVPWHLVAGEHGARLTWMPLTPDGRIDLDRLDEAFTPRTRMVAVTGMSNVLGTIPPVREIAARAKRAGALILVDAAQSIPHGGIDVQRDGIDLLAFSGHKLYGPSGVGVLYGRRELLNAMQPALGGGHMIERVSFDACTWAAAPARFEAGTLPIAQVIALKTAIDYVRGLGFEAIHSHEQRLLAAAHERLSAIPGLRILGPAPDQKGPIISFVTEGAAAQDVALLLDRQGIAVRHGHHCAMPLHEQLLQIPASVRASFGVYNLLDDVERLASGLERVRQRLRLT